MIQLKTINLPKYDIARFLHLSHNFAAINVKLLTKCFLPIEYTRNIFETKNIAKNEPTSPNCLLNKSDFSGTFHFETRESSSAALRLQAVYFGYLYITVYQFSNLFETRNGQNFFLLSKNNSVKV